MGQIGDEPYLVSNRDAHLPATRTISSWSVGMAGRSLEPITFGSLGSIPSEDARRRVEEFGRPRQSHKLEIASKRFKSRPCYASPVKVHHPDCKSGASARWVRYPRLARTKHLFPVEGVSLVPDPFNIGVLNWVCARGPKDTTPAYGAGDGGSIPLGRALLPIRLTARRLFLRQSIEVRILDRERKPMSDTG